MGAGKRILDAVSKDPLSAGLEVLAGPPLATLGLPAVQQGSNAMSLRQLITVTDAQVPGPQLYHTEWQDADGPAAAEHRAAALAALRSVDERNRAVAGARKAARGEVLAGLAVAVHGQVPVDQLRQTINAYPNFDRTVEDALSDLG